MHRHTAIRHARAANDNESAPACGPLDIHYRGGAVGGGCSGWG